MINDPAIQHPPYLTFGALRVHVQRHLPAARHGQHRPGRDAAQAQRPLGDVGVAGEGRRHRVVQGPGRALLGAGVGRAAAPGSPAASTSRRLAPWRAGSGLRRAFRQGRDDVLQQRRRHIGAEKADWCRPDDRPTRLSSICRSRRPTRHRGNRNWCRSSRPAAAPDCPIHRTGGRGGRRFPGCPGQSRRLRRSSYGTPPGAAPAATGDAPTGRAPAPVGAHQLFQCGAASAQNQAQVGLGAGRRRRRTPPASITEAKRPARHGPAGPRPAHSGTAATPAPR